VLADVSESVVIYGTEGNTGLISSIYGARRGGPLPDDVFRTVDRGALSRLPPQSPSVPCISEPGRMFW
jgi:hypothetical protein